MAMPQRDDPPSRCALRRPSTIEAIKRLDALLEYAWRRGRGRTSPRGAAQAGGIGLTEDGGSMV